MAMKLDRRSLLLTASGAAALPLLGLGSRVAFAARDEVIVRIETDIEQSRPGEPHRLDRGQHHHRRLPDPGALQARRAGVGARRREDHRSGQRDRDRVRAEPRPDVPWRLWRDDGGGREVLVRALHHAGGRRQEAAYADDWGALDKVEVTGKYTGRILFKNPAPAIWVIGIPRRVRRHPVEEGGR